MARIIDLRKARPKAVKSTKLKKAVAKLAVPQEPEPDVPTNIAPIDAEKMKMTVRELSERIIETDGEESGRDLLFLYSKAATTIYLKTKCSECGRIAKPVSKYSSSSAGIVCLCAGCEPHVLDRSFGRKDALEKAIFVGQIESSRKRH